MGEAKRVDRLAEIRERWKPYQGMSLNEGAARYERRMAYACRDVPYLLDEIERLVGENKKLRCQLEWHTAPDDQPRSGSIRKDNEDE